MIIENTFWCPKFYYSFPSASKGVDCGRSPSEHLAFKDNSRAYIVSMSQRDVEKLSYKLSLKLALHGNILYVRDI